MMKHSPGGKVSVLYASALMVVLVFAAAPFATADVVQDTTEIPQAEDMSGTQEAEVIGTATTLEDLTADPTLFYGQQVLLEGVVNNLINPVAFVLGEGVALDDDQVLVINTSGQPFDIRLSDGARFRVTGMVYTSFADGGLTQLIAALAESGMIPPASTAMPTATPDALATDEMNVPRLFGYSTSLADIVLPENLFNHTIVAVQHAEEIQLLELPQ